MIDLLIDSDMDGALMVEKLLIENDNSSIVCLLFRNLGSEIFGKNLYYHNWCVFLENNFLLKSDSGLNLLQYVIYSFSDFLIF